MQGLHRVVAALLQPRVATLQARVDVGHGRSSKDETAFTRWPELDGQDLAGREAKRIPDSGRNDHLPLRAQPGRHR
jgi:hypothetical protein